MAHPLTRVASHHLTPAHWPLGRHTLILTTPHHHRNIHTDCFRCLACSPAARAREARRPQVPTNAMRSCSLLQPACQPCTPRQPDGCIASKDVTEACFTHSLTLHTTNKKDLRLTAEANKPATMLRAERSPSGNLSLSPNTSNLSSNPSYPPEDAALFPFHGAA
eukprot:scaffold19438_cov154-Isochrysis_galbana.AAC.2